MSGADETVVPEDLGYTAEHEWARGGEVLTVGITEFAVSALGDVVYLELPPPGTAVHEGERCGEVESTKSVSDLYSPASGTVVEVNAAVIERPELLNQEPYGRGWLFAVRVAEPPTLLSPARYREICEGQG